MPTDTSEIYFLLEALRAAANPFTETHTISEKQRQGLVLSAERLAIAAREPEENVYHIATQVRIFPIWVECSLSFILDCSKCRCA